MDLQKSTSAHSDGDTASSNDGQSLSANSEIWDKEAWAAYYADRSDDGEDEDNKIEHCGLTTTTNRITTGWYKGAFYDR